jgi:Rieske Fe-S protein
MNRRESLRNIAYLLWIPLGWLVFKLDEKQQEFSNGSSITRIGRDFPQGISFYGAVIASKKVDKFHFLSATCTHLGCQILTESQGILICPCHGSQYDHEGKNLHGPATKPLETLTYGIDMKTGDFLVNTPAI